jgi:hypothetical protein
MSNRLTDEQIEAKRVESATERTWVHRNAVKLADEALARGRELVELRANFVTVSEALTTTRRERDEAKEQLAHIDEVLARRPALAARDTRLAKIERACTVAGRAERAEAEVSENERLTDEQIRDWTRPFGLNLTDDEVAAECLARGTDVERLKGLLRESLGWMVAGTPGDPIPRIAAELEKANGS